MAFDPYERSDIKRHDTDTAKLTLDQIKTLTNWCDCQRCSLTDSLSLAEILALFHVSIDWDTFEDWTEEEPAAAVAAYNGVVKNDPARRLEYTP